MPSEYPQAQQKTDNTHVKINTILAYTLPGVPVVVFANDVVETKSGTVENFSTLLTSLRSLHMNLEQENSIELSPVSVSTNVGIWCFERKSADQRVLVIVNNTNLKRIVSVQVPSQFTGSAKDYLRSQRLRVKEGRLSIVLRSYDAMIVARDSRGRDR